MKKFLSLLLALTLVLSLVVVPARAEGVEVGGTYAITTSASSLARGDSTTFTVTATAPTVTDNGVTATDVNVIGYSWSTPGFSGAAGTGATTGTLTASNKAENVEVSCTLTIEYKVTIEGQKITRSTTKVVKSNVSIADKLLPGDITTVTFNGRTYSVTNGAVNISLLDKETIDAADNKWSAAATGYVIDDAEGKKPTYASGKLTVCVKDSDLWTNVSVTPTAATVTAEASLPEVISGGKTTLTEHLAARFGSDISVVHHDNYYKRQDRPFAERCLQNYDHPDAFDTDLMIEDLKALKRGETIHCPVYDYAIHNRTDETVEIKPTKVVIVERILIFQNKALRDLLDIKIFVETDADVRILRRALRDVEERGRSLESVVNQYLTTVKPMHEQFVEPTRKFADIIVLEGGHNLVALDMIMQRIAGHIKEN